MQLLIIFAAKYLFVLVAVLAVYAWWRLPRRLWLRVMLHAAVALGLAIVLVKLAGALHSDVRPFVAQHFTPLVVQRGDNGFPSDHTTFTMLAAFVLLPYARRWGVVLGLLALLVGLGRIGAGVHSPLDIVGGIAVAAVAATSAYYEAAWITRKYSAAK